MAEQLTDDNLGNVLGERRTYAYTSDRGTVYNMDLDNSLAVGVNNTPSTDDSLDGLASTGRLPLSPRYINVVATADDTIRKKIVITSPTNPLFTGASSSFTANGVAFTVLSSRGEKRPRFRVLSNPAP